MIAAQQVGVTTAPLTIKPSSTVMMLETAEGCVLINQANDYHYGLDPIGKQIWQLLGEYGDVEAVVAQMLMEYEVEEANLRQDLDQLLNHWRRLGLFEKPTRLAQPPKLVVGKWGWGQRLAHLWQKLRQTGATV